MRGCLHCPAATTVARLVRLSILFAARRDSYVLLASDSHETASDALVGSVVGTGRATKIYTHSTRSLAIGAFGYGAVSGSPVLALVRDIVEGLPPQSSSREIAVGLADGLGKAVVETRFQRFIADGSWLNFASVPAMVFAIGQVTTRGSDLAVTEINGSGDASRTVSLIKTNDAVAFWPKCLQEFAKKYDVSESVARIQGDEQLHEHAVQLIADAILTERRSHDGVPHCGLPILVVRVDSSGARTVGAQPMAR